jgi:anti-sigma factor ChrR (cupin superfamily)
MKDIMTDMFRSASLFFLLLAMAGLCPAATREQQAAYFAGIFVLSARSDLSDSAKARYYRELERVSGMTAAEARLLLAELRDRPEEWRPIYDRIMVLFNESQPAARRALPGSDTLTPRVTKRR